MICAQEDFTKILDKRFELEYYIQQNLKPQIFYNNSYLDLNIYYELLDNNKFSVYYYDLSTNIEYFKEFGLLNEDLNEFVLRYKKKYCI